MPKIKFSDGWEIDTSGEYRIVHGPDGWYVTGHGWLIPADDYEDAEQTLKEMKEADARSKDNPTK